jgi:cellulose synthase (UDP-forming)
VCADLPRYRREERFATAEPVQVSAGKEVFTAPLLDISIAGARILAPAPAGEGNIVWMKLQDVGEVAARIVRGTAKEFAVAFVDTDRQQDALIRKIYCGSYGQRPNGVATGRIFNALVARAIR